MLTYAFCLILTSCMDSNEASEARFIDEFLLPITRSTRGGPDLSLATVAMDYERRLTARLAELGGTVPFTMAASRRNPVATAREQ